MAETPTSRLSATAFSEVLPARVWNQKVRLTEALPGDTGTTHPVEYLKKQARIGFGFFRRSRLGSHTAPVAGCV